MQARHLIHYVPHSVAGPGMALPAGIAALLYVELGSDVYGWYAQSRRSRYSAAFFVIEKFYAERASLVARSMEDDVHGPWERELPMPVQEIRSPVPEALGHELERLQSAFIDEWLFFPGDPESAAELAHYRDADLPLFAFNVRSRRLTRLWSDGRAYHDGSGAHQEWTHQSAGADPNIFDLLQKCWRLDACETALGPAVQNLSAMRGSAL